tara:strand:+ start:927 stop:1637 length:711 start_codon:yes stop_codon:yes gene_type:complete
MMTFKQHMELSESLSQFDDISIYLESLDLVERLKTLRAINESYPLKDTEEITEHIRDNFNYSEKVFDLVLGQFIMVEQILTGKFKFKSSMHQDLELMMYLLRPKDEPEFDNGTHSKEQQHRKNILNTPVQDLYSAINIFLKDREIVLFKKFSGVFYSTPDETDEEGVDTSPTPDELFNQQWYWYSIVRNLAQDDIRRYDAIYMLKMNVVLPEMSYLAQKNKIDAANQRQQAALNRL